MSRREASRKVVNQSALVGAGLGLLPFRFAAPAIAAVGMKMLKDVREQWQHEVSPVEQAASAAVLGASEFALGQAVRATRLIPWVGPLVSAALTGAALKGLGEGAIAYYQHLHPTAEADARTTDGAPDEGTRVSF
ncbi:MAG: hypothetical protein JNK72_07845 [Myxococcales bacterium]|nr:hypothetical protein [Myxococcales bacterium]